MLKLKDGVDLRFYLLDSNGKWLPKSHNRFSPNHLSINRLTCVAFTWNLWFIFQSLASLVLLLSIFIILRCHGFYPYPENRKILAHLELFLICTKEMKMNSQNTNTMVNADPFHNFISYNDKILEYQFHTDSKSSLLVGVSFGQRSKTDWPKKIEKWKKNTKNKWAEERGNELNMLHALYCVASIHRYSNRNWAIKINKMCILTAVYVTVWIYDCFSGVLAFHTSNLCHFVYHSIDDAFIVHTQGTVHSAYHTYVLDAIYRQNNRLVTMPRSSFIHKYQRSVLFQILHALASGVSKNMAVTRRITSKQKQKKEWEWIFNEFWISKTRPFHSYFGPIFTITKRRFL